MASWTALALIQAGYYAASGLWPLLHLRSHQRVTGVKTDRWLVRSCSLLVLVITVVLGDAAWRGDLITAEHLGFSSAIALLLADGFALSAGMRRIYALDALLQGGFLVAWWSVSQSL